MPIQTATSASLDKVQNVVLAACRFTAETATPMKNLVEMFTLGKGEKQITVPKVGAAPTAHKLVDGVDLVTSESLTIGTTDLTTSEAGLKFILTDKLIRQFNEDVIKIVGRLMGQSIANLEDDDLLALLPSATLTAGAAAKTLSFANWAGCAAICKKNLFPRPIACVQHPYSVFALSSSVSRITSASTMVTPGYSADKLKDFWQLTLDSIPVIIDGRIVPDGSDDAIGAFLSKNALCYVKALAPSVERERDASLRAWEFVYVADYGVFLLDSSYILQTLYDAAAPSTSA